MEFFHANEIFQNDFFSFSKIIQEHFKEYMTYIPKYVILLQMFFLKIRLLAFIKAWPSHRIWSSSKLLIHIHGTNLFMRYDEEIGFSYAVHLTKFWEFYMDVFIFIFLMDVCNIRKLSGTPKSE